MCQLCGRLTLAGSDVCLGCSEAISLAFAVRHVAIERLIGQHMNTLRNTLLRLSTLDTSVFTDHFMRESVEHLTDLLLCLADGPRETGPKLPFDREMCALCRCQPRSQYFDNVSLSVCEGCSSIVQSRNAELLRELASAPPQDRRAFSVLSELRLWRRLYEGSHGVYLIQAVLSLDDFAPIVRGLRDRFERALR